MNPFVFTNLVLQAFTFPWQGRLARGFRLPGHRRATRATESPKFSFAKTLCPCARILVICISAALLDGCVSSTLHNAQDADEGGVAVPAASVQKSQSVAALVGSDLGLGGGYLIGADPAKIHSHDSTQAVHAARHAEEAPASIQQARDAATADLNHDGFITLDEVVAMKRAGLSDQEMLDRLRATGYTFQLSPEQERYLTDRGVTETVTNGIRQLNGAAPRLAEK